MALFNKDKRREDLSDVMLKCQTSVVKYSVVLFQRADSFEIYRSSSLSFLNEALFRVTRYGLIIFQYLSIYSNGIENLPNLLQNCATY